MRTDLAGSWGIYPWFPELGDDLVAPDSLDVVRSIRPYGKLFNCSGLSNGYLALRYRDQEFFVRPDLYIAVQCPRFCFLDEARVAGTGKVGVIVDIEWHYKRAEPIFYLEFSGKRSSKQYFQSELVPTQ